MLRNDELKKVRRKSTYDENSEEWTVPPFIFKQKDIVFPKVNGLSLVNNALDQRKIEVLSARDENT